MDWNHYLELALAAAAAWQAFRRRRAEQETARLVADPKAYEQARREAGLTDDGDGSLVGKAARLEYELDRKRKGLPPEGR